MSDRQVWCVIVSNLHAVCWECDGGGNSDVYFLAATSRREASDMVFSNRTKNAYDWEVEDEARHRDIYPYKAFPVREWRGKTSRFISESEVVK